MGERIMTLGVAAVATGGLILRPWKLPEAIWAVGGALFLVLVGLLPWGDALQGIARGTDVYLFLTGMMLLAELGRREGLFDWLSAWAVRAARGSAQRLFTLVFGVGLVVTVFLSNDATAVVLTPAVAAVARASRIRRPMPLLLCCAFIANAASFVLPISNPANLVVYGSRLPPLGRWLAQYTLPSVLAIAATYGVLLWSQRGELQQPIPERVSTPELSWTGGFVAAGILGTGVVLLVASTLDRQLGLPTFLAGMATAAAILLWKRERPWPLVRAVSWGVLPLVAGLFVLVESLERTGAVAQLSGLLQRVAQGSVSAGGWTAGVGLGLLSNLFNNLPVGLLAGSALQSAHLPPSVTAAALVGVDLGPNLSVTGSLATILWLTALRREGIELSSWRFLKLGALVMPAALVLAVGALLLW